MNIVGSRLVVFGGQVEGVFYNDMSAFDLNELQDNEAAWENWTALDEMSHIPKGRTNHTMVAWNDRLYL